MKLRSAFIALAAGALSLALVAPAAAAIGSANDLGQQPIAPAGPGDNGKPENPGPPIDPGPPEDAGQPDDIGLGSHQPPELPENASPKAEAAVTAAYERFELISERIDAIRELEAGPGRSEALNALFADFGDLIHSVSDAVRTADAQDDDGDGVDPEGAEITLADEDGDPEEDGEPDDDDDPDEDPDEDDDSDDDQDDEDDDDDDED